MSGKFDELIGYIDELMKKTSIGADSPSPSMENFLVCYKLIQAGWKISKTQNTTNSEIFTILTLGDKAIQIKMNAYEQRLLLKASTQGLLKKTNIK